MGIPAADLHQEAARCRGTLLPVAVVLPGMPLVCVPVARDHVVLLALAEGHEAGGEAADSHQ